MVERFTLVASTIALGIGLNAGQLQAQHLLRGIVQDQKAQALSEVSLRILALPDSSLVVGGTTNSDGRFELSIPQEKAKQSLLLRISSVGYKTQDIALRLPSESLNIRLEEDAVLLDAVQVVAKGRGTQIDRKLFTFPEAIVKATQTSRDLLRFVPDLHVDLISGAISSISEGGSVLLLINGIEASVQQLKQIPSHQVKEIIYYDIPPARYASRASAVVNVVAPQLEKGVSYGFDAASATATGWIESYAYLKLNRGRHQFTGEYELSYRNYSDRIYRNTYTFQLSGVENKVNRLAKDHFHYTIHSPTLRYSYQVSEQEVLQVSLAAEGDIRGNDGEGIRAYDRGGVKTSYKTAEGGRSHYWRPVLDLYYSKKLGKKSELSANAVLSLYNTKANKYNYEYLATTGSTGLRDDMNLKNRQSSTTGELAYSYTSGIGQWNLGYRFTRSTVDYKIDNSLGLQNFETSNTEHYAYAELRGRLGKLSYVAGLGLRHLDNKQSELYRERRTLFTPQLVLSQALGKGHALRLQLNYRPYSPSISSVSNNRSLVVEGLVDQGNPNLKTEDYFSSSLRYSYGNKWLNINAQLIARHTDKVIVLDAHQDPSGNYYIWSRSNAKSQTDLGGSLQLELKPLGDMLSIRTYLRPLHSTLRLPGRTFRHFSIANSSSLTFMYQSLIVQYSVGIANFGLSGGMLSKSSENHSVHAQYQRGKCTFHLGWSVIGQPSHYSGYTIPGSLVDNSYETNIYDNKNMIVLGFSYHFSSGKQQQVKRNLQNKASEAVTF